jgi:hypothetical protein
MCSGLGKKLFKVFQEVWSSVEQLSNLRVHILDGLGLPLVGLQNLKELLVDLWRAGETVLD